MRYSGLMMILWPLGVLLALVASLIWRSLRPDKRDQWPVTEGTIQSVNTEYGGPGSGATSVGDFSYEVEGEYYSGRVSISSFDENSPKALIGCKISVRYNPRKPEDFFLDGAELNGMHVVQHYNLPLQSDLDPTDLKLDKN